MSKPRLGIQSSIQIHPVSQNNEPTVTVLVFSNTSKGKFQSAHNLTAKSALFNVQRAIIPKIHDLMVLKPLSGNDFYT